MRYTRGMQFLSIQAWGALYAAILFVICAVGVHAFRLAAFGYKSMKKKPSPKKEETQEKSEPVYYLVERKKKRRNAEYSDPKRFQFK